MSFRVIAAILCLGLLPDSAPAQAVDMTGYRPQPGLLAVSEGGSLTVTWDGEKGQGRRSRPDRSHPGFGVTPLSRQVEAVGMSEGTGSPSRCAR